jgi:mono/diheme cytochrome c family protein
MSQKLISIITLILLTTLLSACLSAEGKPTEILIQPSPTQDSIPPTATPAAVEPTQPPPAEPRPYAPAEEGTPITARNEYFSGSGLCVTCHRDNIDQVGNDVSLNEFWLGSMMAHSAVDPYYLAGVSMNVAKFPEYSEAIQSKCSSCHMPMAHTSANFKGEKSLIFGPDGFLNPGHPLHELARDGNSCSACHQIQDKNLGEFSSFSGGFVIDDTTPLGERALFGRFNLHHMSQRMMAMASGFISLQGDHLLESEICATCHNLYTHYVLEDGTFSEEWFPEQTPYSEWLHSDYATQSTCQDCHMPAAEGAVLLSNLGPAVPREPFAQHSFLGGNAYMLDILINYGGELGVQAGPEQLDPAIERTVAFLENETARLEISAPVLDSSHLEFDIITTVLTGHKFPTGYPSRRAWLHVVVKDGDGEVFFESGAVGEDGSIAGNANDEMGNDYEPHYELIHAQDQVQIYETILADVQGNNTTVLLAAASYLKDNRLLPTGFNKETANEDIKPKGEALVDGNFTSGRDIVRYRIDPAGTSGPYTVEVQLLYQSISYRWAMDLREYDTEQAQLFSEYYDASPNLPVVIASQAVVVE